MVVVAISSLVLLAIMSMLQFLTESQAQDKFVKQVRNLHEEVRAQLSSVQACVNTFNGIPIVGPSGTIIEMTTIKDAAGGDLYVKNNVYGDNAVRIQSIKLDTFQAGGPTTTGEGTLNILYAANSSAGLGARIINQSIQIHFEKTIATNLVQACVALARMTDGIWRRALANPNNTFFSAGYVGINKDDPTADLEIERFTSWPIIKIRGSNGFQPVISLISTRNNGTDYPNFNDYIGQFSYRNKDNSILAEIYAQAAENQTNIFGGTDLVLSNAALGTNISRKRIVLTAQGTVQFHADLVPNSDANPAVTVGTPTRRFSTVYAANGTIQTSDERLKKNIEDIDLGLEFINELRPVSYRWKRDGREIHYGFIAQETEKALRESTGGRGPAALVKHEQNAYYGMNYAELIAPLTKAVQELSQKSGSLREENEALRSRLDTLEKRLQHLEASQNH